MDEINSFITKYKNILNNTSDIDLLDTFLNDDEYNNFDNMEKDDIMNILNEYQKKINRNNKLKNKKQIKLDTPEIIDTPQIIEEKTLERIELERKFNKLKNIILPEQRSPEWFAMRNNKITASDAGMVLGLNKYEAQYQFVLNKVFGKEFLSNEFCYHGKKFEQVVTMYYEYANDVIVDEFGLLGHNTYSFLGASPDGIVSKYKRDNKTPTPLLGRMLEIKCPFRRKICYTGDIKGDICPIYYWCQVQLQLECCDLDECDFVQCVVEEYKTRQDFISDTHDTEYLSKISKLPRGIVIELLPKNLKENITDNVIYDKTTFLYPPKIDLTIAELDEWVLEQLDNLPKDKILHRVIYWKFNEIACHLIKRDKIWFDENLDTFRLMWDYVEMCRSDPNIAEEFKNFVNSLSIKNNKKIMKKLDELYNR